MEIIAQLRRKNIVVTLSGNDLKVRSTVGETIDQSTIELIRDQKQSIIEYLKHPLNAIVAAGSKEYYDVSHAQRRVLTLCQLEDAALAYNCFLAKRLLGELNFKVFKAAYHHLMQRHESHRTVFKEVNGQYFQKIMDFDPGKYELQYVDLRNEDSPEESCQQYVDQFRDHQYDFENGPLLKSGIFHLNDKSYVFMFNIHHVISDGWSLKVFFNELIELYELFLEDKANTLLPLTIQYKDFAEWQNNLFDRSDVIESHREFWLKQFRIKPTKLSALTDFPRPEIKSYVGDKYTVDLGKSCSDKLQKLSQRYDGSLFMILTATVKLLLHKYTGSEDITLGTAVAGREHPDLENQIGFYINTLALRTYFLSTDKVQDFYFKVREVILKAYQHQLYPFDFLIEELGFERDLSHSPLFDVSVVLQSTENLQTLKNGIVERSLSNINIEDYQTDFTTSIYDLSFRFFEDAEVTKLDLIYNTDLFERQRIAQLVEHFKNLVTAVHKNEKGMIQDIHYMSSSEIETLLSNIG